MSPLKLYFLIVLSFVDVLVASEHLPCSRSGTNILFINGMFNTERNSTDSRRLIENLYSSPLRKNEIDSSGNVSVTSVYNKSLYKINEELGGNNATAGKFSDIIEVAGQYIEDRVDLRMGEPESAWALVSTYFTRVAAAKYKKDPEFKKKIDAIVEFDRKIQGIIIPNIEDNVTDADVASMVAEAKNQLKEMNKKVIVVSHSQGNFFANKVYDKIFLNSEENEVYQDLWGNLQLASPASFVAANHGRFLTAVQDQVMGYVGARTNISFTSDYRSIDPKGHTFSLHLSPSVTGRYLYEPSHVSRSMEEIFRENMNEIAKSLAPNCGCNLADLPLRVHPNGGGLIGVNAIVDDLARVAQGSYVCGTSVVSKYVNISHGSIVKNTKIDAALSHLEIDQVLSIGGLDSFEGNVINIENADIDDSTIKGVVGIGGRLNGDESKRVVVKNNSKIISFEEDGESYLRDFQFSSDRLDSIGVSTGYVLDTVDVQGMVSFWSTKDESQLVSNSKFINTIRNPTPNLHLQSMIRIMDVNITNSNFLKSNRLNSMGASRRTTQEPANISNVEVENSSLSGSFFSTSGGSLSVFESFLIGDLSFSGQNQVEFTTLTYNYDFSSKPISSLSNVSISGVREEVGTCNNIWHPVIFETAQINCSTIYSSGNYFKNVNLTDAHIMYANIETGNILNSFVEGGNYEDLTAENESYIYATEEQSFSGLVLDQSRLNLISLTSQLTDATFTKTLLYGVSQLSIPTDYSFKDVLISVNSLTLEEGVVLEKVYLTGDGQILLGADVIIKNASLSTNHSYGLPEEAKIQIRDSAQVLDSVVTGRVTIEDNAKILANSIVSNSIVGESATISHSSVLPFSEIQSTASVTNLSRIASSRIEPNVNVISSDIREIVLTESVVSQTCFAYFDLDYQCEDGTSITEWEVFDYLSPFDDNHLMDSLEMGFAST